MLVKQVMASPKSYSIWEHRVWTISLGLKLEKEYLALMKAKKAEEKAAATQQALEEKKKSDEEAKGDEETKDDEETK